MPESTPITVTIGSQSINHVTFETNILGPSATQPTPTTGFTVSPVPIEIDGIKYWVEWRVVDPT